jgi:hypothetical protein
MRIKVIMVNVKNLVLGIGIVVIFGLVLWQGIEAFYPTPEYSDFCDEFKRQIVTNLQACEEIGGQWNPYEGPKPIGGEEGYCDRDFTCRAQYDDAKDSHSKVVFIISLIVGLAAFLVGYGVLSVEPVGSALIGSGIWAIFWGSAINWRNFSSIWRFLLLLLSLVVLIWMTLRLNKEKKGFFGFFK